MGAYFRGSTAPLVRFAEVLRSAGDDALPTIAEQIAEEMVNLSAKGFKKKADPYGARWAPRVRTTKRNAGKNLLVATGVMRDSVSATHTATTATVQYGQSYAQFHQDGTSKMVARKLVPDEGRIPDTWATEFADVAEDVLEELFGG